MLSLETLVDRRFGNIINTILCHVLVFLIECIQSFVWLHSTGHWWGLLQGWRHHSAHSVHWWRLDVWYCAENWTFWNVTCKLCRRHSLKLQSYWCFRQQLFHKSLRAHLYTVPKCNVPVTLCVFPVLFGTIICRMPEVNLKKARQAQQNKSCVLPAVNIQEKLLCFIVIFGPICIQEQTVVYL